MYYLLNSLFLQVAVRLQKELDETNAKLKAKEEASNKEATKKKTPMLGTIGKVSSGEVGRRSSKFFVISVHLFCNRVYSANFEVFAVV